MVIKRISLKQFRAHEESVLAFHPGLNIISGPNGTGKTNILEAVHYLCLTKSFLTSNDRYVLRHGAPFFEIIGDFESSTGQSLVVRIAFLPGEGKKIFVNGVHVPRASDFVGRIPVVVFSPDDYVITAGGPEERRRFIDTIISQSSRIYLDDLIRYRRTLKQRNELLQSIKRRRGPMHSEQISSWSRELVDIGSRIIHSRLLFIERFSRLLDEACRRIGSEIEEPRIFYRPLSGDAKLGDVEEIKEVFSNVLQKCAHREWERGLTLAGPHRDDLHFELDGMPVRRFASQGQHRTFGRALKLSQDSLLLETVEEPPLLLLDDVFDNLDHTRIGLFFSILHESEMGQSLITAARKDIFGELLGENSDHHLDIRETIASEV